MVLLVEKFGRAFRFPSRLDHHPSHDDEALLASSSLRAFQSEVSKLLNQILKEGKPGSEFLSLAWCDKCFEAIPMIHRAFAAFVVDIDYPMAKWDAVAADEYLNYSLDVLDLLNKVSFSLTHLGQARLSLAHGLSLLENLNSNSNSNSPSSASKHLLPVCPKQHIGKDLKLHGPKGKNEQNPGSGKDSVIREALLIMKSAEILLLGFMISGLCGDGNLYFGIRNSIGRSADPSVTSLDSVLSKEISENGCMVKEVREVNAAVAGIAASARPHHGSNDAAAKELSTKLEVLESFLNNLGKQTDNLFSGVLAARNKLLDTVRHKQKN